MDAVTSGFVTVEVFVLVDSEGTFVCHEDAGRLLERWSEEVGDDNPTVPPTRVLCIQVKVPKPREVVLVGEVKAEPSDDIALAVQ